MRILFIIQWFQPETTLKGLPFAREFQKLGHEIEVLTGFPKYPDGKIYPGYKVRLLQREEMEGVSVVRVPLYPSHDMSGLRRFANYASYALSASSIGPWVVKRADVAYVYHPPATVGLPASAIKILRGIPFVYDIQDLWPDTLQATGMFNSRPGLKLMDQWCKFVYRMASKITVLSPGFKRALSSRGVPAEKIEVVYNFCDDTVIRPVEPDPRLKHELGLGDRFNIMFAGNMGRAQALETVLKAAQITAGRLPHIQFVLVGGGVEANDLKQKANQMRLKNVRFLPRWPRSEIATLLSLADVVLVHLKDDPLFRITIPSKVQAYMSAGRPILIGVRGDAADLVLSAQAGLQCEPENPESIAEAAEKLCAMSRAELFTMGENGRRFYERELALSIGARRFERIFRSVVEESKRT